MKKITILIFLLASVSVFSQDTEMLGYINQYRASYGKKPLIICGELNSIAKKQVKIIETQDSLSHSKMGGIVNGEICDMGTSLPITQKEEKDFIDFLKTKLNISYSEPTSNVEAEKYVKLYIIYLFNTSPEHKKILLGEWKKVGFTYIIKDMKYVSNYINVLGKKYPIKNMANHYTVKFYCVVDFTHQH